MEITPIYRGSSATAVTNPFTAISRQIKEPHATAVLGYLLAHDQKFQEFLVHRGLGKIMEIRLEEYSEEDSRHDLVIRGIRGVQIIEAKLGREVDETQIRRYRQKLRRLTSGRKVLMELTQGNNTKQAIGDPSIRKVSKTWSSIGEWIDRRMRSRKLIRAAPRVVACYRFFSDYLKEGMVMGSEAKEKDIVVRNLNWGSSLELAFRYGLYRCQFKYRSMCGFGYFAPLLTKAVRDETAKKFLGLSPGLSFVFKILDGKVIRNSTAEIVRVIKDHGISKKEAKEAIKVFKAGLRERRGENIVVLRLGKPRRLFQTPLSPVKLRILGAAGLRSYSLDELLELAEKP